MQLPFRSNELYPALLSLRRDESLKASPGQGLWCFPGNPPDSLLSKDSSGSSLFNSNNADISRPLRH
jgi:hypothetical protein